MTSTGFVRICTTPVPDSEETDLAFKSYSEPFAYVGR